MIEWEAGEMISLILGLMLCNEEPIKDEYRKKMKDIREQEKKQEESKKKDDKKGKKK